MRAPVVASALFALLVAACGGGGPEVGGLEAEDEVSPRNPELRERGVSEPLFPVEQQQTQDGATVFAVPIEQPEGMRLGPATHVALFPCAVASEAAGGVAFQTDGQGVASRMGETRTGAASITAVNGEDTAPAKVIDDVLIDDRSVITFTVAADSEDCALTVVFDDRNGNGRFDVSTDPFGVATFQPSA